MSGGRGIVMAVAAALASGCSLLVSTEGLVGTDAGATDASADALATGDGSDAATGDGPVVDAADGASAKPFCLSQSPRPAFCADFDTGTIADFKERYGTVSLETAVSSSPPRSLLAVVEAGAAQRGAVVAQSFAVTPASYDVSFDVYISEYDATHDVELMTVRMEGTGNGTCTPDVAIRNGLWVFDEYCVKDNTVMVELTHKTDVPAPLARWIHVSLSVSFSPARTYSLSIDDKKTFDAAPLGGVQAGPMQLHAGITFAQTAAGRAKIYFDNIRFDFR